MLLKSESNENTPWKVPISPSHNSYVGRFAQDDDILDKIPINILSPGNYSAHNHHPCGTGRADKIMIIIIITIVKGTQWAEIKTIDKFSLTTKKPQGPIKRGVFPILQLYVNSAIFFW